MPRSCIEKTFEGHGFRFVGPDVEGCLAGTQWEAMHRFQAVMHDSELREGEVANLNGLTDQVNIVSYVLPYITGGGGHFGIKTLEPTKPFPVSATPANMIGGDLQPASTWSYELS